MPEKQSAPSLRGLLLLSAALVAAPPPACEESPWLTPLREAARLQGANRHAEAICRRYIPIPAKAGDAIAKQLRAP